MTRFLVLGAGFVAEPVVEYLSRNKNNQITLADYDYANTQKVSEKYPHISNLQIDVSNKAGLTNLIKDKKVVLSLVPAPFHPLIAQVCIEQKVHLVTASYETDAMRDLAQQAEDAGIVILNEIGLDPGIDHLSAMEIIDKAHENGEEVESFTSWCGGIPAVDDNDNPLGYKFSWEPRGALMALLNDAVYLHDDEVIKVKGKDLLLSSKAMQIADLDLEGYPNRESISYKQTYGIESVKTILRGTLRYQGFSHIIQSAKSLGLLNPEPMNISKGISWRNFIALLNAKKDLNAILESLDEKSHHSLEWIGCFSDCAVENKPSALDAFCALLLQKLSYQKSEKDMVILQHEFVIKKSDGSRYNLTSVLKQIGEVDGYSAMAKTVGYPAAMAAQLIADNKIANKGLILPVTKDIYQPILALLKSEGIEFQENKG
jgi:saccharopine dehydrogenase-like NADP-dependent oxidoreductase